MVNGSYFVSFGFSVFQTVPFPVLGSFQAGLALAVVTLRDFKDWRQGPGFQEQTLSNSHLCLVPTALNLKQFNRAPSFASVPLRGQPITLKN